MKIRIASPLQTYSYVDGKGIRMVVWNQGCKIQCPGCHNPNTWSCHKGSLIDVEELIQQIKQYKNSHQGVTLSGGDPFLQPEANVKIAEAAHAIGLDV